MATPAMKRTLSNSTLGQSSHSQPRLKRHQPGTPLGRGSPSSSSLDTSPNVAVEQMRRTYEAQLTALQLELQQSQSEVRQEQERRIESESSVAALERERRALLDRWDERQEDVEERLRAKWSEEKQQLERDSHRLDVQQSETRQALEDVQFQLREAQHRLKLAEQARESSEEISKDLEVQNNNLRTELSRRQQHQSSSPAPPPASSSSSTFTPPSSGPNQAERIIRKELQQQLSHVKTLEAGHSKLQRENARLAAHVEHTALLRERLASLQVQVKSVPRLQAQLAQAETELLTLKTEQQSWLVFLTTDDDDDEDEDQSAAGEGKPKWKRPEDVTRDWARLSSQNQVLHQRLLMAKDTHAQLNTLVANLEEKIDALYASVEQEKQNQADARKTIRGLQRSERLLQTERNFLLAQLDNYALERRLDADAGQEAEGPADRMRHELEELKKQLSSASQELSSKSTDASVETANDSAAVAQDERGAPQHLKAFVDHNTALEEELATVHTQLALASKENASLQAQLDKLSHLVGLGAYDPSATRVLEFKHNPASQDLAVRTQELDLLTKENKALLARLDAVARGSSAAAGQESGGSSSGHTSAAPSESMAVLQAELQKAKEALVQKDKVAQRIKEAFRTRALEMRSAVAGLLGFKLDMKESGQIRLSSIYSPSSSRHLMFQPASSGNSNSNTTSITEYKLVGDGSGLSAAERQSFGFWVGERKCIPAWLANMFIEEYEGATRGGKFASVIYAD